MSRHWDALSLLTAYHYRDREALELVLDHADLRPLACQLTRWLLDAFDRDTAERRGYRDTAALLQHIGMNFAQADADEQARVKGDPVVDDDRKGRR